ncbi:MAG TPA: LCP family protein [Oscillospiraceae bacterium]|nr:LCP family protein [Oscillospiraceae bacterium]HPF55234.1 LCP family protein [Clostridiales bacterium]HPK35276.1 LCP family protein [Oscillospiraceae bacterium]HPR75469.1 LCP family protein [Oscillospiraceae bacterium]
MTISNTRIKVVLAALAIMAAIIAVTSAVLCSSKPFSVGQTVAPESESTPVSSKAESVPSEVKTPDVKKYLIIGEDENGLTDTLIVAFCDLENGTVKLLSIPRDTYVGGDIPTGKINAVYAHAKYPYTQNHDIRNLAWVLKTQLGVEPDGYLKLTFEGFRNAVDAIGGIPIYLPKALYDTHSKSVVLTAGEHVLDGTTAELFVRFRSGYFQGDLGRVEAQKRFLAAAMKRAKELSAAELTALMTGEVISEVESDLTAGQLVELARFLREVSLENVNGYTLPGVEFDSVEGLACYAVNRKALLSLLNTEFYGEDEQLTLADIGATVVSGLNYGETYQSEKNNFADLID